MSIHRGCAGPKGKARTIHAATRIIKIPITHQIIVFPSPP
jgi:hypothetical protein